LCHALHRRGDGERATRTAVEGLALFPESADLHCYLGNLRAGDGQSAEAIDCFLKALSLRPDYVEARANLGNEYQKQDRLVEAASCYRQVLALRPDDVDARNNLGSVLKNQGRVDEAAACFRNVLALDPAHLLANNNLGTIFQMQGNLDDALVCYRNALAGNPDHAIAQNNLAGLYQVRGERDNAVACYRRALELEPANHGARMNLVHQLQWQCEWSDLEANSGALRRAVRSGGTAPAILISPFSFLALPGATAQEQKLCASQWAQCSYRSGIVLREKLKFDFGRARGEPLHIGYLSADFHDHATARLMAELFELHDRNRVRVTAYSCGRDDGSEMRKRLERAFDRFVDIGSVSDEAAATRIYADEVDILVDLKGYTDRSRSSILALRPAPVQVNYLGYPGTMGAAFVDYLIADSFIIPATQRDCYAERVMWLPDCYQPNDRSRPRPAAPERASCGLPERGLVFCCFNQSYKITPDVFAIWCRLLDAVPGSVLWLLAGNPSAERNLKREGGRLGIEPARLVMARDLPPKDHLARLQCADLFLDTVPVNAHTTCSDALWMGLPLVTCTGDTFPSRVAGSLLMAMGVPELITTSLNDYAALALELAMNAEARAEIRRKLASNRDGAPLFDSRRFARNLEAVYAQMWHEYIGGGTPAQLK
jgi:predicted O-linked N-acetylglucosamine transferase (SPINDLY family)